MRVVASCAALAVAALAASTSMPSAAAQNIARPLHLGYPVMDDLQVPQFSYFYFSASESLGKEVMFTVAGINGGDPDLYLSCGGYPTSTSFTWKSDRVGPDFIVVTKDDANHCTTGNWMLGVTAHVGNVTFVAEAQVQPDVNPFLMVPGIPIAGTVGAFDYIQYRFTPGTDGVSFTLTPLAGDPDIYVGCHPGVNDNNFTWSSTTNKVDVVHIQAGDRSYCSPMYIAITGFRNAADYVMSGVTGADQPVLLEKGTPVQASVADNEYVYFKANLETTGTDIFFDMTPSVGDSDMFIGCETDGPATSSNYRWSSVAGGLGDEHVAILPNDPHMCDAGVAFSIGVFGASAGGSDFGIVVSSWIHQDPISLSSGVTQGGQITDASHINLYQLDLVNVTDRNSLKITFSVTLHGASCTLLVSSNGAIPTKKSHQWASPFSYSNTSVTVNGADPNFAGPPVVVALYGESTTSTPGDFKLEGTVSVVNTDEE